MESDLEERAENERDFLLQSNEAEESVLAELPKSRKIVENWGSNRMGLGVETCRDPWYFHRPVFSHLWQNSYLGVGHNGAKRIDRYHVPRQHLYYLSMLLHEALLKEEYAQAAYAMIAISQNPQHLPEQIWRCGMEVLKKCPSTMIGTSRKYQKLMSLLCPQYSNQMVLDMAFEILSNGNDILESYQFLLSNINNKRVKYDVMFRAYIGMFEYALWKLDTITKKDTNLSDDEQKEDKHSATNTDMKFEMHFNAKRALNGMGVVLHEAGVWDIFVTKMVEILDYYNQREEVLSLLEKYRKRNMENPNTHRYLYWYLKKTDGLKEKQFSILKDLAELDVTNELMLEFFALLKEKGQECELVELQFKRLDHPCCKNNPFDWKRLFKLFKSHKKSPSCTPWIKIKSCLEERKDWWPMYHFSMSEIKSEMQSAISDEEQRNLKKYKRRIARFFNGNDSPSRFSYASEWTTDAESTTSKFKIGSKRHLTETSLERHNELKKKFKD